MSNLELKHRDDEITSAHKRLLEQAGRLEITPKAYARGMVDTILRDMRAYGRESGVTDTTFVQYCDNLHTKILTDVQTKAEPTGLTIIEYARSQTASYDVYSAHPEYVEALSNAVRIFDRVREVVRQIVDQQKR